MAVAKDQLVFKLNTGKSMPAVAFGTAPLGVKPFTPADVVTALKHGYRHLDCASAYGNENVVGAGLQEAFKAGLVKREEVFVTTKLSVYEMNPPDVLPSLRKSLSALQLEYVDLYLIHWPVRIRPGSLWFALKEDDFLPLDLHGSWKAMEECVQAGLTRAIGVSNFSLKTLKQLLSKPTTVPAVNQIERHPGWEQTSIVEYCKKMGIHVVGWSALGGPGYHDLPLGSYGSTAVIDSPIVIKIAEKYGKTPAQVALRWNLDGGCGLVTKSTNPERIAQNLDIFDFSLTEEDHQAIKAVPLNRILAESFYCVTGSPYTVENYWDEG